MKKEKQIVRSFYDDFGWHKNEADVYYDTATFVDTRPVLADYYRKVRLRVKRYLKPSGRYFLNAGSGAIPNPEYLQYWSEFYRTVCVDLSIKALEESRSKLREKGFYVLADVTCLPFRDGVFDSTVSTAVLYHIPADEQMTAVQELYRTLNEEGHCVITYGWPTSLVEKMAALPGARQIIAKIPGARFVYRKLFKGAARTDGQPPPAAKPCQPPPPLYHYEHDYRWFREVLPHHWDVEICCWCALSQRFVSRFIAATALGRFLLRLTFWLENTFPHALVKLGAGSMIVIRKKTRSSTRKRTPIKFQGDI